MPSAPLLLAAPLCALLRASHLALIPRRDVQNTPLLRGRREVCREHDPAHHGRAFGDHGGGWREGQAKATWQGRGRRRPEPDRGPNFVGHADLGTQTKELQDHQTAEIGKAVKAMEERTNRQLEHVRKEIQTEMSQGHSAHADALDRLQEGHSSLSKRLAALEARGTSTIGSTEVSEGRRQAVVLGGWPRDTPRNDILSDVKGVVAELDIQELLGDYFVPGQRNSICICPFDGHGSYESRGKMLAIIGKIQAARFQTEHLADGKHVWATLSKPKAERERSSHTSKMRRLLYALGWDAKQSDPEYATGTLWAKDKLLGSATRPRPRSGTCEPGKAENSWIQVEAFCAITGTSSEEVVSAWRGCWEG